MITCRRVSWPRSVSRLSSIATSSGVRTLGIISAGGGVSVARTACTSAMPKGFTQRVDADDPLDPVIGLRALEELHRIGPRRRLVLGRDPVLELDTDDICPGGQGFRKHLGPQARREDERPAGANAGCRHVGDLLCRAVRWISRPAGRGCQSIAAAPAMRCSCGGRNYRTRRSVTTPSRTGSRPLFLTRPAATVAGPRCRSRVCHLSDPRGPLHFGHCPSLEFLFV